MSKTFLTTVVGSMPKRPLLYSQVSFDSGETDHHGHGGDWALQGRLHGSRAWGAHEHLPGGQGGHGSTQHSQSWQVGALMRRVIYRLFLT